MKVRLQRKVEVWVEEVYDIDDINLETIENLINYENDCYEVDTLWETQEDLGPVEIYDEDWNVIYSNIKDE